MTVLSTYKSAIVYQILVLSHFYARYHQKPANLQLQERKPHEWKKKNKYETFCICNASSHNFFFLLRIQSCFFHFIWILWKVVAIHFRYTLIKSHSKDKVYHIKNNDMHIFFASTEVYNLFRFTWISPITILKRFVFIQP